MNETKPKWRAAVREMPRAARNDGTRRNSSESAMQLRTEIVRMLRPPAMKTRRSLMGEVGHGLVVCHMRPHSSQHFRP